MIRHLDITRLLCLLALVASLAAAPQVTYAQTSEDDYRETTDINRMFHKLGRGLSNVLLGWVELPKSIAKEWRETEPFTGTIVGTVKGLGWTVARTLTGVYEVVTFPFPIPREYAPVMYPEFVLPSVWGERLPIYQDEFLASQANQAPIVDIANPSPSSGNRSRTSTSSYSNQVRSSVSY